MTLRNIHILTRKCLPSCISRHNLFKVHPTEFQTFRKGSFKGLLKKSRSHPLSIWAQQPQSATQGADSSSGNRMSVSLVRTPKLPSIPSSSWTVKTSGPKGYMFPSDVACELILTACTPAKAIVAIRVVLNILILFLFCLILINF